MQDPDEFLNPKKAGQVETGSDNDDYSEKSGSMIQRNPVAYSVY